MNTPKSQFEDDAAPEFEADDEFEPQAPDPWRTAALATPVEPPPEIDPADAFAAPADPDVPAAETVIDEAAFDAPPPSEPAGDETPIGDAFAHGTADDAAAFDEAPEAEAGAPSFLDRLFSTERLFGAAAEAAAEPSPPAVSAFESEPQARTFSTEHLFATAPEAEPEALETPFEPEQAPQALAAAAPEAVEPAHPFGHGPHHEPEPAAVEATEPALEAAYAPPLPEFEPEPSPAEPARAATASEAAHTDFLGGDGHAHGDHSVPRIGIHIFFARPETAEAAESASRDRRMARASTAIRPGGVAAAVDYYQNQPTPPLVVVESLDDGRVLLGHLDRLAEVCDPGTKVLVIGSHNDIALYRELMRRGVSEYIVPPLNTLQLIRTITSLYADPSAPFVGRQIAFCGARGGVGSSTIAHNLAYTLSERMQSNTVIVDFDLPFGTAGLDFNQDPLQGVVDALHQPDRLDSVLLDRMMVRCTERLSLFAAPATLDDDYEITADAYEEVANKIRSTAPFVVLDLPHVWSGWMRRMLLGADDVVITAVPDLACLRNAKNIVDLVRQARPNDAPPRLVFNQLGIPGRPEIPLKDFSDALGLEPGVAVPFDAKLFGQASNHGQMLEEVNPKSKAAEAMQSLAQIIARREAPPAPKKSALSSLFRLK